MKKRLNSIIVTLLLVGGFFGFVFVTVTHLPSDLSTLSGRHNKTAVKKTIEKPEVSEDETYPIDTANKKYVGVYLNNPGDVESVYNNSANTVGWFVDMGTNERYSEKLKEALDDHKYTAFITLEPTDMDLNDIANGVYDEKFSEFFTELSKDGRDDTELFVRFAHEMEMRPTYLQSWYSWQTTDSDAYVRAYQHVVNLGRSIAKNVKWVWSPNRADIFSKSYYPGDDYVDYVGLSMNNTSDAYKTFEDLYVSVGTKESIESYNKPVIICECAESSSDESLKTSYLQSTFDYIKKDDNIVGVIFFDEDVNEERQYKFSDNAEQLSIFRKNARQMTTTTEVTDD
jgi:beta-mannanase